MKNIYKIIFIIIAILLVTWGTIFTINFIRFNQFKKTILMFGPVSTAEITTFDNNSGN